MGTGSETDLAAFCREDLKALIDAILLSLDRTQLYLWAIYYWLFALRSTVVLVALIRLATRSVKQSILFIFIHLSMPLP